MSLANFEAATGISKVRISMVEHAGVPPDRDVLSAYLETCQPDTATRARIRQLWVDATTHHSTSDTRAASELEAVVQGIEHDTPPITFTVPAEAEPEADVHYRIAKPAWRRSVAVSRADTKLWPDPDAIASVEQLTKALLAIKNSTGLSYQKLATASQRHSYPLARSTLHTLCTGDRLPTSSRALACFIEICGGSKTDVQRWTTAWQRLAQNAADARLAEQDTGEPRPGPAEPAGTPPVDTPPNTETANPAHNDQEENPMFDPTPAGLLARHYTISGYTIVTAAAVAVVLVVAVTILTTLALARPDLF